MSCQRPFQEPAALLPSSALAPAAARLVVCLAQWPAGKKISVRRVILTNLHKSSFFEISVLDDGDHAHEDTSRAGRRKEGDDALLGPLHGLADGFALFFGSFSGSRGNLNTSNEVFQHNGSGVRVEKEVLTERKIIILHADQSTENSTEGELCARISSNLLA